MVFRKKQILLKNDEDDVDDDDEDEDEVEEKEVENYFHLNLYFTLKNDWIFFQMKKIFSKIF